MGKVIGTTFVRIVIVVIFGFYLKFIDNDLAGKVSGWLMNQEQTTLSGSIQDPVLSGIVSLESKVDAMSGVNVQLEESMKMLKKISEKLGITSGGVEVVVEAPAGNSGTVSGSVGTGGGR